MASPKIGSYKQGKKISHMSNSDLMDKLTAANTRGRDRQKISNLLTKRGVKL